PLFDLVQHAEIVATDADMPKLWGLANTMGLLPKPAPGGPITSSEVVLADPTGTPSLGEYQVQSGMGQAKITIDRAGTVTNINVDDLRATNLALGLRGQTYRFPSDASVKLAAAIDAADDPGAASMLKQVRKVTINSLAGDIGMAKLGLMNDAPTVLTNLD